MPLHNTTDSDETAIRPFQVNVPEAKLADLRKRINATIWPEKETVADASQGVQLATIQKLARYWGTEYDWRKCEARLNALPNFITEIDGLDIHFIHVRSKHENALPIIVTHGWPGSVVEQMKIIEPLDQSHRPRRQRRRCFPCRDSVDGGLRFFGQADDHRLGHHPHGPRLDRADEAPRLHAIRGARRRLGCARHGADGRAGASGIARHPHQLAFRRTGGNLAGAAVRAARRPGSRQTRSRAFDRLAFFFTHGLSYAQQMANHPQTLYGIADSPVGLAAWFLDHDLLSYEMIARAFDGQREGLTRDDVLDNITLTWLTNTAISVGSSLSGEQAAVFRADGRQDPHCRERLSG